MIIPINTEVSVLLKGEKMKVIKKSGDCIAVLPKIRTKWSIFIDSYQYSGYAEETEISWDSSVEKPKLKVVLTSWAYDSIKSINTVTTKLYTWD